ncbi:MBL fold metallo-hydrolase [Nitrospira sp. M1]
MPTLIRRTFPVPPLSCNCSILGDPETKQAVVVDPGGNAERILREVEELGLQVSMILHTHAHFDHFLASGAIQQATEAPIGLHQDDRQLWEMLEVQCQMFGVPYAPVPPPNAWLGDDDAFNIGEAVGTVIHTPGHTPGSLCFYFSQDNLLLSGDTLFRGGIGRTDLWGGDPRAIEESIRERLYTLQENTVVVPGHGRETQIGIERQSNAFITG